MANRNVLHAVSIFLGLPLQVSPYFQSSTGRRLLQIVVQHNCCLDHVPSVAQTQMDSPLVHSEPRYQFDNCIFHYAPGTWQPVVEDDFISTGRTRCSYVARRACYIGSNVRDYSQLYTCRSIWWSCSQRMLGSLKPWRCLRHRVAWCRAYLWTRRDGCSSEAHSRYLLPKLFRASSWNISHRQCSGRMILCRLLWNNIDGRRVPLGPWNCIVYFIVEIQAGELLEGFVVGAVKFTHECV